MKSGSPIIYAVYESFLDNIKAMSPDDISTYKCLHSMDVIKYEELLRATYNLLKKCNNSRTVLNVMEVEINYFNSKGDGYSLLNDIANILDLDEIS